MRRMLLLWGCLSLLAGSGYATHITVSGNVSGTWNVDTVLVAGEITVPTGQTLTIQPGVEVIFQGYYRFVVNGALNAAGTAQDSIRFSAADSSLGWHGLRFINAAGSSLEFCRVSGGRASGAEPDNYGGGLYCENSSPDISHTLFSGNSAEHSGGGVWCTSGSLPYFLDCRFYGNQATVNGAGMGLWQASPFIARCEFINNDCEGDGGGIFGYESAPSIRHCVFSGNSAVERGGGLYLSWMSSPYIWGCLITGNSAGDGGGIYGRYSTLNVRESLICSNYAQGGSGIFTHNDGGGIALGYDDLGSSSLLLQDCIVANNQADHHGGGLYCGVDNNTQITGCRFHDNACAQFGGGIAWYAPGTCTLDQSAITNNHAGALGGGLYNYNYAYNNLRRASVVGNVSDSAAGGIYVTNGPVTPITSAIFWSNSPQQVGYVSFPAITYSDVQGGWPGVSNINQDPLFADTSYDDYRLSPGSPCIDTGNPDVFYNDPDGTRSDMGAYYFDQSVPVHVLLTPHQIPYLIPATGGSMDFTVRVINWSNAQQIVTAWCDVSLPDSSIFGPVLGPVTLTLPANGVIVRRRTQNVPASAPLGVYHYNAYAEVGPDISHDSFMFGKFGFGGADENPPQSGGAPGSVSGWSNSGEEFARETVSAPQDYPSSFRLYAAFPNPFNAMTAISYQLPADSYVSLRIYDTAGKLVRSLAEGWRSSGSHRLTFDAADLPSGMYFCQIQAGEFEAVQKLILLK